MTYTDTRVGHAPSGHIAALVSLDQEGRRLGIANTHLKWDPPGTPRGKQYGLRQVSQLLRERDRHLLRCGAWIICGDLNATPDSDVVALIETTGFRFAHDGKVDANTSNTNGRAKMIDYIFHSATLSAEPHPVSPVNGHTVLPGPDQPSDHVAVAASFSWN